MHLAAYLRANKESQAAFARRAGLTKQMVNNYARGIHLPRMEAAAKIEKATDGRVTSADLLAFWQRATRSSGAPEMTARAANTERPRR